MELDACAARCRRALEAAGCKCLAYVRASERARDLAFQTPSGANILLRCSEGDPDRELGELVLVSAQRTFDRIALVHSAPERLNVDAPFDVWSRHEFEANARGLAKTERRVS